MNWLNKLFGYTECGKCKEEFKKNKNTSCGIVNGETSYWCDGCSNEIVMDALSGRKPKLTLLTGRKSNE